jgi:hypothetical protein
MPRPKGSKNKPKTPGKRGGGKPGRSLSGLPKPADDDKPQMIAAEMPDLVENLPKIAKSLAHGGVKYKPEMCEQVILLAGRGLNQVQIATALGVSEPTFYRWAKEKEDFRAAVEAAQQVAESYWIEVGARGAVGALPVQFASYAFQMKNRFGDRWRDTREHQHTFNVAPTMGINLQNLSEDQLVELDALLSIAQAKFDDPLLIEGEYTEIEDNDTE